MKSPSKLKSKLEKELEELTYKGKLIEAECYRYVNAPLPANFELFKKYVSFQSEIEAVYKLFNTNRGDPLKIFMRHMQGILDEQKKKQVQINKFREKLSIFDTTIDEDGNVTNVFHTFCINYRNDLIGLKAEFSKFFTDIINKLKISRRIMQILIEQRKSQALNLLQEIDDKELLVRKEYSEKKKEHDDLIQKRLSRNSLHRLVIFSEDPDTTSTNEITKKIYNDINNRFDKAKDFINNFEKIFEKFDQLDSKLHNLEVKLDKCTIATTEAKERREKSRIENLRKQIAENQAKELELDRNISECNAKLLEITPIVERERELSTKIVAGTNMTHRQLRNEASRIAFQIGAETLYNFEYLEKLTKNKEKFEVDSDALIKQLEDEEKSKSGEVV
ncbi:hypothetical protein TVAG_320240 [Trichomonas vaginalis G3]|uniref:DUF4201 domain-containing protein n=1 Tax=Trichomonas vaginalis (strain ATCC PRA-98 / G3) TaxID=412133 RepID=A2DQH2_TRIV3|nr:hypothetical protein TVAGG3_1010130 [Trichomonas vaginalis G3]EAY17429.1 hypothetical protein TVAG_320240 [Trichomonas vaginalis G3]KAI5491441.1 hypothetical protein TVAGG3_1010130 [Trichomonas vaginalis G3]|eukprot:XP_001330798.1 hypothetical protein [Trichomonas vaginalis G3]